MVTNIDLTGRVAIVTGAAGGLGKAYAKLLAERGAAIVVNDLGGDTRGEGSAISLAEQVAAEIREAGGRAVANCDNVATKAGGEAITACALESFGRVDIVVNNAGNQRNALFEDLTEDDIESVLAVHLKGAFDAKSIVSFVERVRGGGGGGASGVDPSKVVATDGVEAWDGKDISRDALGKEEEEEFSLADLGLDLPSAGKDEL